MVSVPDRAFDHRRQPKPINEVLAAYLEQSGLVRILSHPELYVAWQQVAGERVVSHTRVGGLRRGVLEVEVDSASLLHELVSFEKQRLVTELRERLRDLFVKDIRFRLANLSE